tara:strand:+ start:179 stop:508 length:330 start_codon:yes stop_codon:yes gene_type:complete
MNISAGVFCLLTTTSLLAMFSSVFAGDEVRGQRLAEKYCLQCHAASGAELSPNPNAPALASFKKKWPLIYLEEALAEGIVTGHDNDMPMFTFSGDEIDDLISYLNSLVR